MPAHRTQSRTGELYVFAEAFLWSLFPIITKLTYSELSPLFTASISTFASSIFFASIVTAKGEWHSWRQRNAWNDIVLASLFTGVLFYALLFTGLKYTTAGNAAMMGLMEVFFSFLILGVILKHERIIPAHIVGAIFMIIGAVLILLPQSSGWRTGDFFVIAACAFAPIGNRFAQRARKTVSTNFIMVVRSIISGCFLLAMAFFLEEPPSVTAVLGSWEFLLINGVLLMGLSKILWFEAIHRIPITKCISLASVGPLFTVVIAYVILDETLSLLQIMGFVPIFVGTVLLTRTHRSYSPQ